MLGLAAAVGVAAVYNAGDRHPLLALVEGSLTVFLCWAIVRELDPDHPVAAVLAGAAAGMATVATSASPIAALAGLMVASRVLTRSTGLRPLLTDIVAVGAFAGIFARTPAAWAVGLGVAAAVALDSNLPEPAPDRRIWLAGAVGVAVTLTAVMSGALAAAWQLPDLTTLVLMAAGTGLIMTAPAQTLQSKTDFRAIPVDPTRLLTARRLAAGALVLGTLVGGLAHAQASWPAWIALTTAAIAPHSARFFGRGPSL